jgi:AMP nucleosidase
MYPALTIQTPQAVATEAFTDASSAVGRLEEIYERNTQFLRDRFEAYAAGEALTTTVRACYPFVRIKTSTHARLDSRLAYGFVARPGVHETSVTRPDLFRIYLTAPCYVSRISLFTVRSSSRAWPASSTGSASASILRSV